MKIKRVKEGKRILFTTILLAAALVLIPLGIKEDNIILVIVGECLAGHYNYMLNNKK